MSFTQLLGHGRPLRSQVNRFINLHRLLGQWESHMSFLSDCVAHKLVPRGLRLGFRAQSREEERWKVRAEEKRVVAVCRAARRTFFSMRRDIGDIYIALRSALEPAEFGPVLNTANREHRHALQDADRRKGRKFCAIIAESPLVFSSRRPCVPPPDTAQTVINLSASPLSPEEKLVLSHGGKFALPPSQFPASEVAARGQYCAEVAQKKAAQLGVTGEQVVEFHNRAAELAAKAAKLSFPPLPPAIKKGLQSLAREERVTIPADKARSLVIMDKPDYVAAVLRTLQTDVYKEVPRDPAPAFNTRFKETLLTMFAGPKEQCRRADKRRDLALKELDEEKYRAYQRLQCSHGRAGAYYGLVKSHKYAAPPRTEDERLHWISTLKLRPICPGYRSVDLEAARHLTRVLQCLPRPPLSIESPMRVLELLEEYGPWASSHRMMSLDVESMFPSIPVDKAVDLIRDLLHQYDYKLGDVTYLAPDDVADLLLLSIQNTHAVFNDGNRDRYWVQQKGLAMGKAFSPVVADLFMGSWESDLKEIAREEGVLIAFAVRYADDYFIVYRGSDDHVCNLVQRLNTKEEAISVTMEMEEEGVLPFLDIRIERQLDKFYTSVFRKECNTGQVVPFNSYTDPKYLQNAVAADVVRARRYCKEEGTLGAELAFIRSKFLAYGYPSSFIAAVVANTFQAEELKSRALPAPVVEPPVRVAIPFLGPAFHALRREASKLGITLVAKPSRSIASLLCSRPKHRLPKLQMVDSVYLINCSCGSIYIGETERELESRVKEHTAGWRKRAATSAFGDHGACQPAFEAIEVLISEPHHRLRLLLESAMIRWRGGRETIIISPNDRSLNRNAGALLSERWLPLLRAHPPTPNRF